MASLFLESCRNTSVVQSALNALKLVFFWAGLISTVLMVKGAFTPFLFEILLPYFVALWDSFRYFSSSPLYICIVINSVVLLIAATSSFHHDHDPPPSHWTEETTLPSATTDDHETPPSYQLVCDNINDDGTSKTETSTTSSDPRPQLQDDDVGRDEVDDTMESTWQTIIAGRTKKVLMKSESVPAARNRTIEDQQQQQQQDSSSATWKDLRKLETFNDGASIRRLGGLRRDPSLGVDDFNRQVEAFINKFNQDMRLQRQDSDQRFFDIIKLQTLV